MRDLVPEEPAVVQSPHQAAVSAATAKLTDFDCAAMSSIVCMNTTKCGKVREKCIDESDEAMISLPSDVW